MKFLRFLISFTIALALTIAFNIKLGQVPPLGKFLDPFHGFWQNAESEIPISINDNIHLSGLNSEVIIKYDESLIPHIFAQNNADLYFAQGFIAARHRLWQMEFQTHAAAGRISEIIGEMALDFDRLQRRKGMTFAAEKSLSAMMENDTLAEAVNAYAEGVNAYIAQLSYDGLPIEYKLLDYKPEEWVPLKSALLLKYMANDLTGWDSDFENTNAMKLFGKETYDFLFPDTLSGAEPVIPKGIKYNFEAVTADPPDSGFYENFIEYPAPKADPGNGSNNWVVAGSKTNSGKPILANDPHLRLNLPSIWFALQLVSPDVNVMGATLLGAPGVIIGFNNSIAWGVTNAGWDVRDWYHIQFQDEDKEEYLFDEKWLKTQKIVEEIKVRGGKTVHDTVIYTHYGPITYDKEFPGNNERKNFAMRWTAHDPSLELMTFYKLNRAKNYKDFKEALKYYENPAQNFAFASAQGNIAIRIQGRFPIKWKDQGKFIMDGSRRDQEWQGFIPYDHIPEVTNPERGYVSSANQYPVGKNYPYYIYGDRFEMYRDRRINQRLDEMNNITPQDMMKLQGDNYNLKAAESLPMMLEGLELNNMDNQEKQAYTLLKNWDYYNEVESKAASLYDVWWKNIGRMLWDEFQVESLTLDYPNDYTSIYILKNFPDNDFVDIKSTPQKEAAKDLIRESFAQAVDTLIAWEERNSKDYKWADFKATKLQHLLRLDPFSVENVQIGGNKGIINAVTSTHGPSWRMVVSLGGQVEAWGIYPGGQSGNPGSKYYSDLIDKWSNGEYIQLLYLKNINEKSERLIAEHRFNPSQK